MAKIICSQIEAISTRNCVAVHLNKAIIKTGHSFSRIENIEVKPIYNKTTTPNDTGNLIEEVITFTTRFDENQMLQQNISDFYIFRLKTDVGNFLVGTLENPVKLSMSDNGVFANFTAKAISAR